ncbi:gamma-glutamylcyclotransferase family protein [Alteriqipengyuania lutimaris]|uniref:Gamma-glutamylcyclotransferase n=1 Tax=Alteriqipengyuania lutimaris TaxID=1538146 RepID=A0A395LJV8_9SPHN|nr:gamma-glutamylcyclotransferase family protein [Alteriqipengyuania lutimaris]MBB3033803.1 gamma-glutamylcyclotransferase (GGCT)/AIG2-like uncharacterized protein YtfP [Alteriqipengyuania lutimaris]RDS77222.1 gamma-glutamylcyclotransferase [Alteriqipengyuania lutimaris]
MGADAAAPHTDPLVFLYGILQQGEEGYRELDLAKSLQLVGPDDVRGVLYDLGDYPGYKTGGTGRGTGHVRGQLHAVKRLSVLPQLDAYELYDPADPTNSDYLRKRVTTLSGREAWIYEYNRDVGDAPIIASGSWKERRASGN